MSGSLPKMWLLLTLTLLVPNSASADEPPALRHNPFARPPSDFLLNSSFAETTDGADTILDLKATMVGNKERLANVAGKMVRPGDDVAGYRLVEVHEDHAVFSKGDKHLVLYVKPDMVEDDE